MQPQTLPASRGHGQLPGDPWTAWPFHLFVHSLWSMQMQSGREPHSDPASQRPFMARIGVARREKRDRETASSYSFFLPSGIARASASLWGQSLKTPQNLSPPITGPSGPCEDPFLLSSTKLLAGAVGATDDDTPQEDA
ncbi:hypothetical protein EMPG_09434 [Blastomyces silverae]|uniref:Uncharacterized protein n=1 Tax=Blastomyces silverae TaxID=2060906 RepID=A0A0H1BV73_9EURO|nr:hypothetical protein EMPG_09434 [Blastomyces silverae]